MQIKSSASSAGNGAEVEMESPVDVPPVAAEDLSEGVCIPGVAIQTDDETGSENELDENIDAGDSPGQVIEGDPVE